MRNDFESNYLAHHGILGMRWGVRRYQNPDGSLTPAGKERYYSEVSQYGEYKWRRLGKEGHEYNKKANKRADDYAGAVSYNVRKVNGEKFNREFEAYKNANKKNNEHYLSERNKWLKNEGKYKGKNYYQFKDIARDEWLKTEDSKVEERAHKKLNDMVIEAAKGHPLYEKTYSRLKDVNLFDDDNPILMEQINYGKYAVDKVMRELEQESRKNHKK